MNFLKRTLGVVGGTIRSVGATLNVLTGGISVKTEDIPLNSTVLDSFSLQDVDYWMKIHMAAPDEPVKVAVVRERHGQLWRVSLVVLNNRNKRCTDGDGRLRAQAHIIRSIAPDLDEFLGAHHSVLLSPTTSNQSIDSPSRRYR